VTGRTLPVHAVVGYVHGGTVRAEFAASMIELVMTCATRIDTVLTLGSGPNISCARNKVVDDFLTRQKAPWLWMLDTDMVFAADALDRLIAAAHPAERPLLGALCYSQNDGASDPYPTMYEITMDTPSGNPGFQRLSAWPEDTCVRVSATGAACLLMHRDALSKVAASSGDIAAPWFRESAIGVPLSLMGEDMTFCLRAGVAGIPVHVHTGVQAGHMKPVMLGKVT
jgi:GT2 family glycosyltransferase